METKTENINIDRNKELFEYEMTEVILQLKGEFAAFSGKGTRYEEVAVDEKRLVINTPAVAEVSLSEEHVELPAIPRADNLNTAPVVIDGSKKPAVQVPEPVKITSYSIAESPVLSMARKISVPVVQSMPGNRSLNGNIILPDKKVVPGKTEMVKIPSLSSVSNSKNTMNTLNLKPDVTVNPPQPVKPGSVDVQKITPAKIYTKFPAVKAQPLERLRVNDISLGEKHVDMVKIPQLKNKFNIKVPVTETTNPDIPVIPPKDVYQARIASYCIEKPDIEYIDPNHIKAISDAKIPEVNKKLTLGYRGSGLPALSKFENYTVPPVGLTKPAIAVPETERPNMFTGVYMKQTKTVCPPDIKAPRVNITRDVAAVSVRRGNKIDIPQKPQVNDMIENIISLAVKA